MSDESGAQAEQTDSLIARLRRELGKDIDPGVSLAGDPEEDSGEEAPSRGTSGVLGRIETHSKLATRYRLDGEIARGGMGAILEVWDEDLRRQLAMKVALSRTGEGTTANVKELDPRILSRFLEEAQVTGQLDHPGVVPVHELGLDENGHVFFTMRLVRGRDLGKIFTLVADELEGWSVTRALGVMLKVCEAMAYAHSKGVIHRDLKPANVMVGRFGEVYVMDWGLARVQGHEDRHDLRIAEESGDAAAAEAPVATDRREDASGASDAELYTMDGDVIGTPSYMAIEQARGQLDRLDARTDVYAAGAMLYRLLGGTAPYVPRGERLGASHVLVLLLEGPPKPLEELAPDVPGELVAICEKAMAREPDDRYGDMLALADDLRAYLENRVVRAYETGALAEARKWVRRNKPLAASLAAGVLALIGGLAASLVLKGRADRSAELAETRRVEAVESADLAEARRIEADANAELAETRRIEADDNAQLAEARRIEAEDNARLAEQRRIEADESAEAARREARIALEVKSFLNDDLFAAVAPQHQGIDVTVREVLDLAAFRLETGVFNSSDPLVQAEARLTLGRSFWVLGEYDRAGPLCARALELRREELGERHTDTLQASHQYAAVLSDQGRYEESEELFRRTIEIFVEDLGEEHEGAIACMSGLAGVFLETGRFQEACELYEKVVGLRRPGHGLKSEDTLIELSNLGRVYQELGRLDEAEEALSESAKLMRKHLGKKHPETLTALNNLAILYSDLGRHGKSGRLHVECLEISREVLGDDHPQTAVRIGNLGTHYLNVGQYDEAQPLFEESVALLRRLLGDEHPDTLTNRNNLASSFSFRGMYAESLEVRLPLVEDQIRVLGRRHPSTLLSMGNLAVLYQDLDRYDEALELGREVLELQREVHGRDHPNTLVTLENLGRALFSIGDDEESFAISEEVLEARKRVLGPDHPDVAKTLLNQGMILESMGEQERALERFETSLAQLRRTLGDWHPRTIDALEQVAQASRAMREFERAAECYGELIEVRRFAGADDLDFAYLLYAWSGMLYQAGEYEAAVAPADEALALYRRLVGDRHASTLETQEGLAKVLLRAGRFGEAEQHAFEHYETVREAFGSEHPDTAKARALLAELYEAWGRPEDAEPWR